MIFDWLVFRYFLQLIFRLTPLTYAKLFFNSNLSIKNVQNCSYLGCPLTPIAFSNKSYWVPVIGQLLGSLEHSCWHADNWSPGNERVKELWDLKKQTIYVNYRLCLRIKTTCKNSFLYLYFFKKVKKYRNWYFYLLQNISSFGLELIISILSGLSAVVNCKIDIS